MKEKFSKFPVPGPTDVEAHFNDKENICPGEIYREPIILNNRIYAKVQYILTMNQQRNTLVLLNFLTTLFYWENTDPFNRKPLIIHAQSMIRTSGCLLCIANIFANGMSFHNTWIALCQCLAESCRDSEENQSYCTYLIPTCVSKCSYGDSESLSVLECLLKNHERNIKRFLDCNGLSLFTNDSLLDTTCMQLLKTLIRNPISAKLIVEKSNIVKNLRDILDLYGPNSQVGQWTVIILYHASPYLKDVIQRVTTFPFDKLNTKIVDNNNTRVVDELEVDDTTTIFTNLFREIGHLGPKNYIPQCEFREFSRIIESLKTQNLILPHGTAEDKKMQLEKSLESKIERNNQSTRRLGYTGECSSYNVCKTKKTCNKNINVVNPQCTKDTNKNVKKLDERNVFNYSPHVSEMLCVQSNETVDNGIITLENFQPIHSSTPNSSNVVKNSKQHFHSNRLSYHCRKTIRQRLKVANKQKPFQKNHELTQKSVSSKFFGAINDSCATIFNTVKSIFKPKESNYESNIINNEYPDCSFSFTNYMRKRDEFPRHQKESNSTHETPFDNFSHKNDTCRTCNDTIHLKKKLANDEYLKQTVKKLKIGINLFGCDFKKISRTFWPKDTYMTPVILYNLYRKLLIK
ncbi:hypothetical protein K1T71_003345 [Dendrolimus kikuchii]|uniref:Uncharacterized protein n=1 Tax=Dendrolimus kikuchii TaxID=765133 RepID=A0ACC1DBN5_9NEOP|nr:hypothetical protein K1T71_003345 [Dendrolimus kikuchii]